MSVYDKRKPSLLDKQRKQAEELGTKVIRKGRIKNQKTKKNDKH